MACCTLIIRYILISANITDILCISPGNTGWLNKLFRIFMAGRSHIVICIGISTVFTGINCVTSLCAGRSFHCCFISMIRSFCPCIIIRITTVFTLMSRISLILAGCRNYYILYNMFFMRYDIFTFCISADCTCVNCVSVS